MRRVKANQKGKSRHFSSPEEIQSQMAKIDLKDGENSDEEEASSSAAGSGSSDESGSDSDEGNRGKPKGVSALIEIENPNRAPKKASPAEPVQLSRREKEEIEKQKAKERYQKLHAAGKTDQAKADLARLAMIKQKREEEAAKKREEARMKDEKGKRAGSSK